jgi:hypothetical protein
MQTLQELGETVAAQTGVTPESLSRFERGRGAEFGSRKLLVVLGKR